MSNNNLKTNGVNGAGSGKSQENKDSIFFEIPGNRNMKELKEELLRESKEKKYAIPIHLKDEDKISLNNIIDLGNFIKQNNIKTMVRGSEYVNFKNLAFTIFCSSHLIFFDMMAQIDMGSHKLRSQKKLQEITLKMSEVIECDEKELMRYCIKKRLIDPILIFEEEDEKYVKKYEQFILYTSCGSYYKRRK